MKKIINGKMYNTDTAKLLCSDSKGCGGDFSSWREELYRKKTGEYFLFGEGGPMSKYAVSCVDNTIGWGEKIVPYTDQEARKWMEDHSSSDDYIAAFGEVEE